MNVDEHLPISQIIEVINNFAEKMAYSGFNRKQIRHCVVAGLVTYENKRIKQGINRGFDVMIRDREIRKLIENKTLYHDRNDKPDNLPSIRGFTRSKKPHRKAPANQRKDQPASVLFAPRSDGGRLLKLLREAEFLMTSRIL